MPSVTNNPPISTLAQNVSDDVKQSASSGNAAKFQSDSDALYAGVASATSGSGKLSPEDSAAVHSTMQDVASAAQSAQDPSVGAGLSAFDQKLAIPVNNLPSDMAMGGQQVLGKSDQHVADQANTVNQDLKAPSSPENAAKFSSDINGLENQAQSALATNGHLTDDESAALKGTSAQLRSAAAADPTDAKNLNAWADQMDKNVNLPAQAPTVQEAKT